MIPKSVLQHEHGFTRREAVLFHKEYPAAEQVSEINTGLQTIRNRGREAGKAAAKQAKK
jgi:hypothetical protein